MSQAGARTLVASRRNLMNIPEAVWDGLAARNPAATPFSRHCLQRIWWEAYGSSAHENTLVVADPATPGEIVGIVPLMHRHEIEPEDVATRTTIRHQPGRALRPVPDSATAIFFGASYHADYATVLAAPDDMVAVCEALADYLAGSDPSRWDVVDLRRLRHDDPATDALQAAFEARADDAGWCVTREEEEVCPVLTLEPGQDFETYLGRLDKKERHEVRRKLRRAEAAGVMELEPSAHPIDDLDAFVELHQKRWGDEGLFPPTAGGQASRKFFAGLLSVCADEGIVDLDFLAAGQRRIAAGVTINGTDAVYYYNAGVDPDARDLSPGVVMVACYIQRAIAQGRNRVDFMRGNESYKYAWGAVDQPIERLLVQRTDAAEAGPVAPDSKETR